MSRKTEIRLSLDSSQVTDLLNALASWSGMQSEHGNVTGGNRTIGVYNEIAGQCGRIRLDARRTTNLVGRREPAYPAICGNSPSWREQSTWENRQ